MTHPLGEHRATDLALPPANENPDKLDLARTDGPMAFVHGPNGFRPVGDDGWPFTDEEMLELNAEVTDTLSLLDGEHVIDVEPESVVDTELDT